MIPELNLTSVYIEVYKSTTWQLWLDTISCNTCYMPSESPAPTPSKAATPSVSPRSPSVTVSESVSPSETGTVSPQKTMTPGGTVTPVASVTPAASVTPGGTVTPIKTLSPQKTRTPQKTVTPVASESDSWSASPSLTLKPSPTTSIFKQPITESPTQMPSETFSPFVNQTAISAITQLADSVNPTTLGGVAVGLGGGAILLIAGKYLMKKFAPGPDGKRPSFSEVASGIFSSAKKKALDVVNEVKDDIETQVKEAVKNPSGVLKAMKDPGLALKSLKGTLNKAVAKNLPASESSVVLGMVDKVLPNEVPEQDASAAVPTAPEAPEAPVTGTALTSIQIDPTQLEIVQRMLELMNKPNTIVIQTDQPPNPSI